MNYITEINEFHKWSEVHHIPNNSKLLWFTLMNIANKCGWSAWVGVSNRRLMYLLNFSNDRTLMRARDELINANLINYKKGKKGSPGRYQIISFSSKNTVQSEVQSTNNNKNTVQNTVNNTVKSTVNCTVQSTTINKHKQKHKPKTNKKTKAKKAISADACAIIDYLNDITGKNFKKDTPATLSHINARLTEGYTVSDFKTVIDNKASDWLNDPKMSKFLRPQTLFSTKFEAYLNEKKGKSNESTSKYNLNERYSLV